MHLLYVQSFLLFLVAYWLEANNWLTRNRVLYQKTYTLNVIRMHMNNKPDRAHEQYKIIHIHEYTYKLKLMVLLYATIGSIQSS